MAIGDPPRPPGLARFFERVVRQALGDLRLGGPTEGAYLAALLTRFARADELYAIPRCRRSAARLRGGALDRGRARLGLPGAGLRSIPRAAGPPARGRLRVVLMTGLFREHVERRAGAAYYIRQGQRAYQAVADFERSALWPEARLFAALAAGFERYAAAPRLSQARLLPPR